MPESVASSHSSKMPLIGKITHLRCFKQQIILSALLFLLPLIIFTMIIIITAVIVVMNSLA